MRSLRLILALMILLLGLSCVKKEETSDYPVVIEKIDGVKTVSNPDYPRDGVVRYAMEEELMVGADETNEQSMLNRPVFISVADDGKIFVMDWGDVKIKLYGPDGKFLRTIGQQGQGPGEFSTPTFMALSNDGRIFLMDGRNHRTVILDLEGRYLGGFHVEGFHSEMKTDAMNRLYYTNRKRKESLEDMAITKEYQEIENEVFVLRAAGSSEDIFQFGPFFGEKDRIRRTGESSSITIGSEFNVVWIVDKNGRLYQGFNQDFKFNVFGPDGKKVLIFDRAFTPVENPRLKEHPQASKLLPPYDPRRPMLDDEGNLWLNVNTASEEEVVYDVFSPEGIYLRQGIFPNRIHKIKNGKVYSLLSTEEGFYVVKRFQLNESE